MNPEKLPIGGVGWHDLTVDNADQVRDFYKTVVGWAPEPLSMGDYSDYVMKDEDGAPTAGVCHARGQNADVPPQWLIYFIVEDMDRSIAQLRTLGGEVIVAPRDMMTSRFCVIRDPAGAVCALYERERDS